LNFIEKAKTKGCDIVVAPEMCVGGYLLGDKYNDDDYCRWLMSFNKQLREASDGIIVIYGNVYLEESIPHNIMTRGWQPNHDGRKRKYNAAYIYQNKKEVKRSCTSRSSSFIPSGIQPKTLLPNYRFFDDKRYFFSVLDLYEEYGYGLLNDYFMPFCVEIEGKEVNIGLELCEDLWCRDYRYRGESINPTNELLKNGADVIINISASPWTHGKNQARDNAVNYLVENAKKHGQAMVPFFYVNCVGAQNNGKNVVTFDGGSTYYGREGEILSMIREPYKEDLLVIDSDVKYDVERREKRNVIKEKYQAIIRGIQHIKDIMGRQDHNDWVIGLSGGVDSAVVAALLVKAVGKDKVSAINMPTQYNSDKTKNAAAKIAKKLGIEYTVIPINDIFDVSSMFMDSSGSEASDLNVENEQARIRGSVVLAGIAARKNALFTNNGNKLETALGYATLYGDVGGAIAPIGDLTKTEVFELARFMNDKIFNDEVIPNEMIPDALNVFNDDQIKPSAELKNDQIDPMKFGYHCALLEAFMDYRIKSVEEILRWYIDGTLADNLNISLEMIKRWNIDDPQVFIVDLEWFVKLMNINVFKRVQSPPNVITSKTAFGYDRRESQLPYYFSSKYKELKRVVKNMIKYNEA